MGSCERTWATSADRPRMMKGIAPRWMPNCRPWPLVLVSIRLDVVLANDLCHDRRVEFDAIGQAFGRGARDLPALGQDLLPYLGPANDVGQQHREPVHVRL